MQKRNIVIGVGVVLIILAIGVAYFVINHPAPTTPASTSASTDTSNTGSTASTPIVQTETDATLGQYLADANKNALYTYGADTTGTSNCADSCLSSWPAYAPTDTSATLPTNVTIITRADGTSQYAYNGMPLYTFTGDSAGKVTGDGQANFHVAKP